MADIVITVVGKLAEYTVAPVLRQFGYLIYYKSNVEDLTEKVTILASKRDGVQQRVEGASRNLEAILPEVQNWLERVNQTIQENETCFEKVRVEKATTCCSSNQWCPNLKVRHSLSRKATKMAPKLDKLIEDGNFTIISCPAPPRMPDFPLIQYPKKDTDAPVKPHERASSSPSNLAQPHAPMDLSEHLKCMLPYTKDLLTALQDDKISTIGISGIFREIDTVATKDFIKRIKHRNLFEEVVMAVVSQDPNLMRIQDEIAEMLNLQLDNGSLEDRAERLRAALNSKRVLVILANVCGILDLEAIGLSHVDIKKSCKIMLLSKQLNVFGEMETRSSFKLLIDSTPMARPIEFESRISVIRSVMDALTDDESNPIVICGMGGIGKTTLVMEIGAKAGEVDLFDEIAVAEFTQEHDLIKIQGKLANDLGLKLEADDDMARRAAKLRERLSGGAKRKLVILDNVWKTQLDLWTIGIPISSDPNSCKVLVTSRDRHIFKDMNTKRNFHIEGLPQHDAWNLFEKMTGGFNESEPELCKIAEQVLNECDGLPVAISTVGKALKGENISTWRNALRELQQACPEDVPGVIDDVYGKIEFSYKCLPSQQARSLFLLCGLFPDIEDVIVSGIALGLFKGIYSLSTGRDCVKALVDTVRGRCLLLEDNETSKVRMHDVVRDVAVYIASKELKMKKNDPLQQMVELDDRLKDYCTLTTSNQSSTELVLFEANYSRSKFELPATIFDGMEDVKVLMIRYSSLPSLPLLRNLQTLVLVQCHLNFDVGIIGELRTLMILNLSGSDIKQLPDTYKNLSNLRLLNLSGCTELEVISPGVISSLSRLEELYMWDSFSDWVVEKLSSTETTKWISQLEVDAKPDEIEVWKILNRLAVEELGSPEEVEVWKNLNRLAVEKLGSPETTTDQVSQVLVDAERSEPAEVDEVGDQSTEYSDESSEKGGMLAMYEALWAHEAEENSNTGDLKELYAKYVRRSRKNHYQHTRWGNSMDWSVGLLSELLSLSRLTTLEVSLPPVLEILRTSKLFHKLERFNIYVGWEKYTYTEQVKITENFLRVHDLDASSLAGTGIGLLLKNTVTLRVFMKNLTESLNVMDVNCLESLEVEDCDSLEYLIDMMTLEEHAPRSVFPVLNSLEITDSKNLKEIFHGDLPPGSLQKLESLYLSRLPALTTIWTTESSQSVSVGDLAVVHTNGIWDCQSLEAISGIQGSGHHVKEINFLNLTRLALSSLPSFTGIAKCNSKGSSLHPNCLTVEHSLFSDPKVVFPILSDLDIDGLGKLEKIWNGQLSPNSFYELKNLHVRDCEKLLQLVPTQMQNRLQTLKSIWITNCSSLEEIFEVRRLTVNAGSIAISRSEKVPSNISLPDQGMQINDIMDFKQACQGFQNLTALRVHSCDSLRYLLSPSIARGLVGLQSLDIYHCQKMEAIVAAEEGEETENNESLLPQLRSLELYNLPNLGSFSQGNYTFDWPLVTGIDIGNCNNMNKFCLGSLSIAWKVNIDVSDSGENLEQVLNDSRKERSMSDSDDEDSSSE